MTSPSEIPISAAQQPQTDVQHGAKEIALLLTPDREENKFFRSTSRAAVETSIHEAFRKMPNEAELSIDEIFEAMRAVQ